MTEFDPSQLKLGKAPVKTDVRTVLLARYVETTELPPPPDSLDLSDQVDEWPMYANDRVGDCTCAAAAHMIEAWTAEDSGKAVKVTEDEVLAAYDAVKAPGGEGAYELDVLNYWRHTGVGGHAIDSFAKVATYDHKLTQTAAALFGGLYIGLALPKSAQKQKVWDWAGDLKGPNEPNSWGGHAVDVVGYDGETVTVCTWGALQEMTWAFWDHYCEESYCIISQDFLGDDAKAPSGLDLEGLKRDLAMVAG